MYTHKEIFDVIAMFYPNLDCSLVGNTEEGFTIHAGEGPSWEEIISRVDEAKTARAFSSLRIQRDFLLQESDWTQMPDAPVDVAAWGVYRQALRDLPENTIDPENPVWPTPPA